MAIRYWAIQDVGGPIVGVLAVVDRDGLPRRFVPGVGLVDWPAAVMFTHGGEVGAHRISTAEAQALMRGGVGAVSPRILATQRGSAPVIPVPRE